MLTPYLNNMKLFNLHTHTHFCDGSEAPENYVKQAIELGFRCLGFSGHSPLPFENVFAIPNDKLLDYAREIRRLQALYKDQIDIYLALEYDYIPGMLDDFSVFEEQIKPDYIIGSIHLVRNGNTGDLWFTDGPKRQTYDEGLNNIFGGDIKRGVKAFYNQTNQMIETQKFDIVGHLDKIKMHNQDRFFSENEPWYVALIDETLDLVKSKRLILEVNTRGIYKKRCNALFPGIELLKKIRKMDIPITLSSDAHAPDELNAYMPEAIETLRNLGFKELVSLQKGKWESVKI